MNKNIVKIKYQHSCLSSPRIKIDDTIQKVIDMYNKRERVLRELSRDKMLKFVMESPFSFSRKQTYTDIFNRGISFESKDVLSEYRKQIISKEWMVKQKKFYNSLDIKEKELLEEYFSEMYEEINYNLRKVPLSKASINNIIDKAPALDKEIIVYRLISINEELLEAIMKGKLISYGYLSTTLYFSYVEVFNDINYFVLKIKVPKGKKCIYYPHSGEYEILFQHNIEIELGDIKDELYYYPNSNQYPYFQTIQSCIL